MNRSAGIGDPYWYEWGIGLLKAVEMLNPDSDIDAVAFQKERVKGWDDVVIRYQSGRQDYYQVKHSRPRTNLSFSDLVGKTDDQPSLLRALTSSWHEMKLSETDSSCILITNRSAGQKGGKSSSGIHYPPLSEFISHISVQLRSAHTPADITVPDKWIDAWGIWLAEMAPLSDDEKFQFLKAMAISVDALQLEEMRNKLAASLASAFQITFQQANSLVQNLLSALFDWTTSIRGMNEWITAEDVMAALSESTSNIFGYCDVPTPVPFFPSREQAVMDIISLLTEDGEHRIVFLEAEPGSGKTSMVSRIVNQRAEDYTALVVDIRYYAYKPITPDSPALPIDADQSASPESLWYTLLNQIRERLRGRLLELGVPVRNHFTKPDEARDHVLRLAGVLAQEKRSPFVIVIDGIDHAARAHRKGLPSLLGSLPAPETVPTGVRLLIAGQPVSAYPEYPIWLKSRTEMVKRVTLAPVDVLDIQRLLLHSNTKIPQEGHEHAARIVQGVADGNTLAVVFSVAEAEICETLQALETRLSERKLHSGVHEYYTVIWQSAVPTSPSGLGAYLSSVLCILRERITGKMMQEAFPDWKKPSPEWDAILKKLEPLVVYDADGYRVRHNDIRVFLEQELRTDEASMQKVASLLADYYMGVSACPRFRQVSLFSLLQLAGREQDKANVFNPNWVLNAAAYGRELSVVFQEAEDAFRAIPDVGDWHVALSVACAGMTLAKLSDCLQAFPDLLDSTSMPRPPLPQCLETERFIPPFSQWDNRTIRKVLDDANILVERGETNRAQGLIEHWFTGISPATVASKVKGIVDDRGFHNVPSMAMEADSLFEDWGTLAFRLGIAINIENPTLDIQQQATFLFEKGWVSECITTSEPDKVLSALRDFNPRYLETVEVSTEKAATKAMWEVVASLLKSIKDERDRLSLEFRVKATYWALKALGQHDAQEWQEVLSDVRTGKWNETHIEMPLMIFIAKSIGWTEPHREASAVASELAKAIAENGHYMRDLKPLHLPLRAAAMIGLVERMLSKGDTKSAAALVPIPDMQKVIELIWGHRLSSDFLEYRIQALDLTFELIERCYDIGDLHREMVLSLAISEAEKHPVDQKMPVLWEVLRRAGHKGKLRAWAEHWIGQDGAAWSGLSYSERAEIVIDLSRLCRNEGWKDLANTAENRLRHHLIGYSSHKEYAFKEPLDWIKELFISDPSAWREEGIQLLNICQECNNQGGDNRLNSTIENEIAAAAFRCGPKDAYEFFNWIDPEVERFWLQTVRSTLIAAGKRSIADRIITKPADVLAVWCYAVGLTRWFNKYQAQTITALRDAILDTSSPKNREDISDQLQALTPGEFLREEYEEQQNSLASEEDDTPIASETNVSLAISELTQKVDEGIEPSLMEIGRLAIRVARENPENRTKLMSILFRLVDVNRKNVTSWDYWGRSHPLKELIASIREVEIWELMRAAIRTTGDKYWLTSVSHNVHLICLYRAAAEGANQLRLGTLSMFEMHRLWAGHPNSQATYKRELSSGPSIDTWPEFTATVLSRLLSSDSAETVSAAIRGLCTISEIVPQAVSVLFNGCDEISRSRLLLGAEVWAARHPSPFTSVIEDLWSNREELSLGDRIQLWICKLAAVHAKDGAELPKTFMPQTSANPSNPHTNLILTKPQRLLEISPEMQGSVPLANAFSAARNWINRFEKITGCETDDIEAAIAEGLCAQGDNKDGAPNRGRKKRFATEDGDMVIIDDLHSILDRALEQELSKPGWTDADAADVSIAVTYGDDPWILRRSPLPSPTSFDWPDQKEVDEWLDTAEDNANILNRLKLMAQGKDLSEDQQVIGSYLRIFTSHYDLEIWYWLEATQLKEYATRSVPLSPSGRSFQFFLPDRFEPHLPYRVPLVLFSRSTLCLSFSTLEVIPSRLLQDQLGWHPMPTNPLEWTRKDQNVARYEVYHGPLDYNWSRRHMRQPTLSRWVVNSDELKELGNLSSVWDHATHPFSDE